MLNFKKTNKMQKISWLTKNSTYFFGVMFVVFQFLLAKNAYTQSDTLYMPVKKPIVIHNYSEIFKKRYWNFLIRPLVSIQKGKVYKDSEYSLSILSAPGVQFGWMINFGLPKRFSLQTGANIELNYFSYHLTMQKSNAYYSIAENQKSTYINYWAIVLPVYASYRIPVYNKKHNLFFDVKAGLDIKWGGLFGLEESSKQYDFNNNYVYTFYVNKNLDNLKISGQNKFSASVVAAVGVNYILKNQRILNFQITGSFNPVIKNDFGTVTFFPDYPYKKVIPFNNYISTLGFEINYLFTKYPKRQKGFKASLKEEYRSKPIRELR